MLRSQTLELERRLEKEKKRLQRHTDDLKNYHHLQNSNNVKIFSSKHHYTQQQQLDGGDKEDGENCSEQSLNNTQDSDFGGKQPQQQQRAEYTVSSSTDPTGLSSRRKLSFLQSNASATIDNKSKYDQSTFFDDVDHENNIPCKSHLGGDSNTVQDANIGVNTVIQSRSKKKRINSQSRRSITLTRKASEKATRQHQDSSSAGSGDSTNEFDGGDNDDNVKVKEEMDVFKRPANIPSNLILSNIDNNNIGLARNAPTRRKMSYHDSDRKTITVGSLTNTDSQINNVKRTQSW